MLPQTRKDWQEVELSIVTGGKDRTLQKEKLSGHDLRDMFAAATTWLEKSAPEIDALNIFPVPDGDTGTNMLLTMRSCIEEAYRAPDHSASGVAEHMARGALVGARGNSGVILSQIYRGLAKGLAERDEVRTEDLVVGLEQAAVTARQGMTNPVEGTILTVADDAAAAARAAFSGTVDLIALMEQVVVASAVSVANTPNLLAVLRDAGVVDAGGQGLHTLFDGSLRYLKGETKDLESGKPQIILSNITGEGPPPIIDNHSQEEAYGYCTNFVLKGEKLEPDKLRAKLEKRGKSLILVGDESQVRVHIHSLDPGSLLHYVIKFGTLHQIKIENMDEQHADFVEMQKAKLPVGDIGIVAVVPGEGLAEVFMSLGVNAVVPGGQTMNPSTRDILQAVEKLDCQSVIVLPNNKNIVTTAEQVKSLTSKRIAVVPSRTIPQGIAALLGFDFEANLDGNSGLMQENLSLVKTIEITRAVRATKIHGHEIKKKQPIGFLDGDLVAVGEEINGVLAEALTKTDLEDASVVTLYYGKDASPEMAEAAGAAIRDAHPVVEVEVVRGGQPHYEYIVSVE